MQKAQMKLETKPGKIWGNSLQKIAYDGALHTFDMWPRPVMLVTAMA
jgi:hypothetical protein